MIDPAAGKGPESVGRLNLFSAFLITLTACDIPSVDIFGGNLRVSLLVMIGLVAIGYRRIRLDRSIVIAFLGFLLLLLPSIMYSTSGARSIGYLLFLVVDFFVLSALFYNQIRTDPAFLRAVLVSYRFQILIGALLVLAGVHGRAQFLYYEPSYFALALILYITTVLSMATRLGLWSAIPDMIVILMALVVTRSATLLLSIILVSAIWMLYIRPLAILIMIPLGGVLLFGFAIFYSTHFDDVSAQALHAILTADDPVAVITTIASRGGNRIPRLAAAFDIFKQHPWLGIGPGAYEAFTDRLDLSDYYDGVEYLAVEGLPPINIYVELLVTTGVVGTVGFAIFMAAVLWPSRSGSPPPSRHVFVVSLISLLVMLNFESSYLRPYLWMIIGCLAGFRSMSPRHESQRVVPVRSGLHANQSSFVS